METLAIENQILEKLNALIVVLDNKGLANYISDSAGKLLGYHPDELIGNNWWELTRFSKPEGEVVKQKILKLFDEKGKVSESFEHAFKTVYGLKKWIRWNVSFLDEFNLIAIGYDVTDKKYAEEKLMLSNKELVEKNKEVTDSIKYAQRIQTSILQSPDFFQAIFKNSFVLYKPKDIVSGDFYFFHQDADYKYVIAVDCTGHGVPGAMMSMVANSIIKEALLNKKIKSASQLLYEMDKELYKSINAYGTEVSYDGMDVSAVCINKKTNRMHYAGAFRTALICRNKQLIELKATRFPLGFFDNVNKVFEEQVIILQPNDTLYLFTDGYIDQFGGERNKKMNRKNFKELLLTMADMPIEEQEAFLDYSFNNWKQDNFQTDDVLVIGIKI